MNRKYMENVKFLYGETISEKSHPISSENRSSRHGQKNGLPQVSRKNIEAGLQMRLVVWLTNQGIPHLSIPNEGNRGRLATHRLKQMGLRAGAADLFITRRSGNGQYGGYWIELKSPGEKPRRNQREFLEEMRREHFAAEWFDDLIEVQQSIINYLSGKEIRPDVERV